MAIPWPKLSPELVCLWKAKSSGCWDSDPQDDPQVEGMTCYVDPKTKQLQLVHDSCKSSAVLLQRTCAGNTIAPIAPTAYTTCTVDESCSQGECVPSICTDHDQTAINPLLTGSTVEMQTPSKPPIVHADTCLSEHPRLIQEQVCITPQTWVPTAQACPPQYQCYQNTDAPAFCGPQPISCIDQNDPLDPKNNAGFTIKVYGTSVFTGKNLCLSDPKIPASYLTTIYKDFADKKAQTLLDMRCVDTDKDGWGDLPTWPKAVVCTDGEVCQDGACAPEPTPPLVIDPMIFAGGENTCLLLEDTTAQCWGDNAYGQLGNGTSDAMSAVPVPILAGTGDDTPLTGIVGMAIGRGIHICALLDDTSVRCWGNNAAGQVGNGATNSSVTVPATVWADASSQSALIGVASITAGQAHTCAVLTDGTAQCWGVNTNGQLGIGSLSTMSGPTSVVADVTAEEPLAGINALVAGWNYTCALLEDTTARCWGANSKGQLGNGSTGFANPVPTPVVIAADAPTPLAGIIAMAASAANTCAILTDGTAWCWGANTYNAIGNAMDWGPGPVSLKASIVTPLQVLLNYDQTTPMAGVADMAVDFCDTAALHNDGTVSYWGCVDPENLLLSDVEGALVKWPHDGPLLVTTDLLQQTALAGVTAMAAGSAHFCALRSDHSVWCVGNNSFGQLGNGSLVSSPIAVPIVN